MLQATRIAAGINDDTTVASLAYQIQSYGRQCAEQVLKDAADSARMIYHDGHSKNNHQTKYHQIGADNLQIDKESILSTPIATP